MGSHLDTVPNGGLYDGSIGVLAGLEVLRTIKEAGLELPVHLEAINFTDEEGAWQSFFGSMGLTGTLSPPHINDVQQDNGAFRVALFRAGIRPGEAYRARREPESLAGFLELHIEQSDKLEKAEKQIGVVERVVGRATFNYNFYGEAVHAATTSPERQRDALQGAAIFITEMHRLIEDNYPQGVVNCGNVDVQPGAFNVIPAQASLQVECRHPDEQTLSEIESRLIRLSQDCARRYRLSVKAEPVLRRPVAHMAPDIIDTIEAVCDSLNYRHMRSISYAGHDVQILSKVTPSALIFVPSAEGISHNPREYTDWDDVTAGANVMLHTLLRLIDRE
jgi:N-carbamoyl-L-amino-acid hydrolase